MAIIQNLYQIFKLPSTMLIQQDLKIDRYTVSQGVRDGNVVSIGDNLVFQQLRYIHGDYSEPNELFNKVQLLRKDLKEYKKQGDSGKIKIANQMISSLLFVKDIINVNINGKKSDFNKFRVDGFYVNGVHYVYLCSGSGQIRRNTATFINEKYQKQLIKTLNCGLDEKTHEFVLAKYSAYFALAFSSILWVRTPKVCVIKDFYHTLKKEPVDFIVRDENNNAYIEKREMDLELNCADGQGLIDPFFAQLWGQDMNLSYTPSSFVARSCFIKGNLVTFDFKSYAYQHNIYKIKDRWGKEYDINDIDVLLSESQFKTHKYYSSWQEYLKYAEAGNIHWGVARYNKKQDDEYVLANYQYIQALSLSTDDIKNLIKPTIDWITQICSGDLATTMLFLFGSKGDTLLYEELFGSANANFTKAIVKNPDFLKDSYIQKKIYKNIVECINHAKIGKIWLKGNYQFMIADPIAQCQSALGLEPVGALKRDEIYSNFWKERKPEGGVVDCCRSPMIDQHEHNPMKFVTDNEDANYWFRYITSGIIYNTYDTSCFRAEDSDYDGDICLTTDNEYFIKGSHKDHNIITYEKGLATPAKMTIPNITATVMKGFGSGVGGFSNTATILYAMAAIFNKEGHEDQYTEIMTRIKLLREIVGQEIDRIKGADKPTLPRHWRKCEKILDTDTQEERIAKMRQNAMVVSKKPYFFRYLYPELNQKFKQFENSYNQISCDLFGIKLKKLFKKEDKTEEEKMLIKRYQKYSPLITSSCVMNKVCREFESIDFDIKFLKDQSQPSKKKPNISMLPTFEDKYADSFSSTKLQTVKKIYQQYTQKRQIKAMSALFSSGSISKDDYLEMRSYIYDAIIESARQSLFDNHIPFDEFLFYCYKLSLQYAQFDWSVAWEVAADTIIDLIPQNNPVCPVRDPFGDIEYLGEKYSLKQLSDMDAIINEAINTVPSIHSCSHSEDSIDMDMPALEEQGGEE